MTANEAVAGQVHDLQDGDRRLLFPLWGSDGPGRMSGTHVVCPWHHACFSVTNGAQEEPPGFDALPQMSVRISGDDIVVSVADDAPAQRTPDMAKPDAQSGDHVRAAAGMGRQRALCALEECLRLGKIPSVQGIQAGSIDWVARLQD